MSKYKELDLGTIEAIVNKLGGLEGVQKFLSSGLILKIPDLLKRLTEVSVSATEKFVARDHIKSANIGWMGSNFKKLFLDKIEEKVSAGELVISELKKDSLGAPIMSELGDKVETKLFHLIELIERQSNGQKETLLVNGYANVAYIKDDEGIFWAVCASWSDYYRYWDVEAFSVEDPDRWDAGGQVLSCK